jgi:hypothetical protein
MQGGRLVFVILALAFAPLSAAALDDLTGTYEGKMSCDSTSASGNSRSSFDTALFLDDANDGTVFIYVNNAGLFFFAEIVEPDEAPDAGRLGGPSCGFTFGEGGALLQAAVRSKAGADKASLRGQLLIDPVGGSGLSSCSFSVRRTTREIPAPIMACPV